MNDKIRLARTLLRKKELESEVRDLRRVCDALSKKERQYCKQIEELNDKLIKRNYEEDNSP